MSHRGAFRLSLGSLLIGCVLSVGCGESIPSEVVALRDQILSSEEPAGAISIEDAKKRIDEDADVTLIVRVGNRNFTSWSDENHATFYVSEGFPGSDYNVGADHDASTCPFCKWKWKEEDSLAIVQVVDAEGEVLPHAADAIFNLSRGSKVTIQGEGSVDETGFLIVQLASLFVHEQ